VAWQICRDLNTLGQVSLGRLVVRVSSAR
jgi:hypothetical protein